MSKGFKRVRWLLTALTALLVLSGCSQDSSPTVGVAAPTQPPLVSVSGSGVPTVAASLTVPAAGQVQPTTLYVREGLGDMNDRLVILQAPDGKVERQLPLGVTSFDWKTLYTLAWPDKLTTKVTALSLETGQVIRSQNLSGQWELPQIDANARLGGLALNGKTLALVQKSGDQKPPDGTDKPTTQFLIVDSGLQKPTKPLQLNGSFTYDTFSADGSRLYLIEHLAPYNNGHYQVKLYDLAAGKLMEQPVVDKSEQTAIMQGYAGAQVTDSKGDWVYTMYRNRDHGPFIHALNTAIGIAICLDLPQTGKNDDKAAGMWSLVMKADGSRLYAVNSAIGFLSEIQPDGPQLLNTTRLKVGQNIPTDGAFVAHHPLGLSSRSMALSSDGDTLFTPGNSGLLAIDLKTPDNSRVLNDKEHFESLVLSPNGHQLYGLSSDQGKILIFDPTSGQLQGTLPGTTRPWSVLRIEPRS